MTRDTMTKADILREAIDDALDGIAGAIPDHGADLLPQAYTGETHNDDALPAHFAITIATY